MTIIEVSHITKEFQLGQTRTLTQVAIDVVARLRGRAVEERAPFKALADVDFRIDAGEVVGVIGQNGAGKSTLLKLLAAISKPTYGNIVVRGKVAPLIEVGAGLVPDLTGRENIFLNAFILGMRRAEIARKFDEIVAFAELEDFIDTPIKRYSSGMRVRLGFSIATTVEADILIVDEVLAVGDLAFQRKCFDRMEEMIREQGKTVLLVSHNIRQVERLCSRVLLLDHGKIVADGEPTAVCNEFYARSDQKIRLQTQHQQAHRMRGFVTSGDVELIEVQLLDESSHPTDMVAYGSDLTISARYRVRNPLDRPNFGAGIHTTDSLYLATHNSEEQLSRPEVLPPGVYRVDYLIKRMPFLPGQYSVRLGVSVGGISSPIFYAENVAHFRVEAASISRALASHSGFVALNGSWSVVADEDVARTSSIRGERRDSGEFGTGDDDVDVEPAEGQ